MPSRRLALSDIKQIEETLKAGFDCDQPIYLLIDPIVGDFLPQLVFSGTDDVAAICSIREEAFSLPVFPVQLFADIRLPPSQHPYLVALPSADNPWMSDSLDIALAQNKETWLPGMSGNGWGIAKVGGWLQSTLSGEQLAGMLSDWMRLKTEYRTEAKYLRLADSRVLALLAHVLGPDTIIARMGRLRRWSYLDARGQPASLYNPASSEAETEFRTLPKLDQAQWKILQNGPLIHGAIAKVLGETGKLGNQVNFAATAVPYAAAITATERCATPAGLEADIRCITQEDHCTAIALTLLHPGWGKHPTIKEYLACETEAYSLADRGQEICDILKNLAEKPDMSKASQHEH